MTDNLKLLPINEKDYEFLYKLLSERKQITFISHKKMPSYDEHIQFIKSKPYTKWYIILQSNKKVGSIYLSKNDEVGLFISKKFQGKNIGFHALTELLKKNPRKRFLANVNPKNKKSMAFFKNNGFKLIQYTFEKTNE